MSDIEYYSLNYDKTKNRIYHEINGFWRSEEVVPNYINDWKNILTKVQPGFTVITDARKLRTPPMEVSKLFETVQRMMMSHNVKKIAKIVPKSIVATLTTRRVSRNTGLENKIRPFENIEEAEKWLDGA